MIMKLFGFKNGAFCKRGISVVLVSMMLVSGFSGCGRRADNENSSDSSGASSSSASTEFDQEAPEVKEKTEKIEKIIDDKFYFDKDAKKQEESYYDGIMEGLDDPYSRYYTKEEYDRMKEDDAGSFSGIGATVQQDVDSKQVSIVSPIKDSPAEKSGLKPGDIILKVGDTEITKDMDLDYVVSLIRGEKGTTVVLKVYREKEKKELEFSIVRDVIKTYTIESKVLDKNIGYISVSQFINTTEADFKAAVDDMVSKNVDGLILDLRSNPGGFVASSTSMADYLIEDALLADGASKEGLLLQTKDKDDKIVDEICCKDGHSVDIPMVILVDKNTASSAEIFTGIMRDYKKATIIGTKTYGKGIVQEVIPLDDGSAIKITISEYYIPSGETVHKVGIEPDIELEYEYLASETDAEEESTEYDEMKDNQILEAIKVLTK